MYSAEKAYFAKQYDWMCILKGGQSRSNIIARSHLIELERQRYKISMAIIEEHNFN